MVPGEAAVPSPQSMLALYSPGFGTPPVTSAPAGSVKVASTWLAVALPSLPVMVKPPVANTDGSVTVALAVGDGPAAEAVPCVTVTLIEYEGKEPAWSAALSSAYWCAPETVKVPPLTVMVPGPD